MNESCCVKYISFSYSFPKLLYQIHSNVGYFQFVLSGNKCSHYQLGIVTLRLHVQRKEC